MKLFPLIKEAKGTMTENHKWAQCREQWIIGSPSPSGYINVTTLVSGSGIMDGEDAGRLQNTEHQEVCREVVFPRNCYINKTGMMAIAMAMGHRRREILWGPTRKNYKQLMATVRKRISLSLG